MRQRAVFVLVFALIAVALVGLNALSHVQKEKTPDSEASPNRSTFNSGATGLQAFFTLLNETGRKPVRWQEPPSALHTTRGAAPSVFVVVGPLKQEFSDAEISDMLRWVGEGGRLVIVAREPEKKLLVTTANWKLNSFYEENYDIWDADPADAARMTAAVPAVRPAQPTTWMRSVNAVQPSAFAGSVTFERLEGNYDDSYAWGTEDGDAPPSVETPSLEAPTVHLAAKGKGLLIEAPYGSGKIVVLTDPYIVSNAGISLADNAQLAVNLASGGTAAFDEYHQGYGSNNNRFLQFFDGTPVVSIFLQAVLLAGAVFYSQSRRFARAVPEPEADRLSKLEYVAAMADLQGRTRAYDLAIENIYSDLRRRMARLLGLDNLTVKSGELARAVAGRIGGDAEQIRETLFRCEEIIRGEPTNKGETLRLVEELRRLESRLGLSRSSARK